MTTINTVALVGVLSEPPSPWDVVEEPGAELVLVVNQRVKRDGEWTDLAMPFPVTVPGKQGDACVDHLDTGSAVGVAGRLTYDDANGIRILAQSVQYLSPVREAAAA